MHHKTHHMIHFVQVHSHDVDNSAVAHKIHLTLDISNSALAPSINQLLALTTTQIPNHICTIPGDLLVLDYQLKSKDLTPNTVKSLKIITQILNSPGVSLSTEDYQAFIDFREFVSQLSSAVEELDTQIALKLADDSSTRKMMAQRLSNPNHQPNETDEAFVKAVLRKTDQ